MYQITKKDNEIVRLMGLDDSGETTATIRRTVGRDNLTLEQIISRPEVTYMVNGEEVIEKMKTSDYVARARKTWICLVDTNILDAEGKKWWKIGVEWDEFVKMWGDLDVDVQMFLYDAVVSQNPHWGNM
jgi:hypothetical protein